MRYNYSVSQPESKPRVISPLIQINMYHEAELYKAEFL